MPDGSVRLDSIVYGCFFQFVYPVSPGQWYAVRADRSIVGDGVAFIRIGWKLGEVNAPSSLDRLIYCHKPRNEWGEIFGVVEVPDGVNRLVLKLYVIEEPYIFSSDTAWFDDVELSLLPLP